MEKAPPIYQALIFIGAFTFKKQKAPNRINSVQGLKQK